MKTLLFIFLIICKVLFAPYSSKPFSQNKIEEIYFTLSDSFDVACDLIRLGIAKENLRPNDTSQDAGPLLEAAIKYASDKKIPVINLIAGSYHFKSVRNNSHFSIRNANGLTLNGNGAKFIFYNRRAKGIYVLNSDYTRIKNLVLDYEKDLPFSSGVVTSVNLSNNIIFFQSKSGRPLTHFKNSASINLKIFILRINENGVKVVTERLTSPFTSKSSNDRIVIDAKHKKALSEIKPGDIIYFTERSYEGSNALSFSTTPPYLNTGNAAINITIHSSPAAGVAALWQEKLLIDKITIEPKPGRDQFISTNADGINISNGGSGNQIVNNLISSSGDDGIAFSTSLMGMVIATNQKEIVAVLKYNLKSRQKLYFSDENDIHPIGTAIVTNINSTTLPKIDNLKQYRVRLDNTLNKLKKGNLIFLPREQRSVGTIVKNNVITSSFSRSIYFAGVTKAVIVNNIIKRSVASSICSQTSNERPGNFKTPPNSDILIQNNTIIEAFSGGFSGHHGAIESSVTNGGHKAVNVNDGLVIKGNKISYFSKSKDKLPIYISNTINLRLESNQLSIITK